MKTFEQWTSLGYYVKQGSKACGWNKDGIPVFDEKDVAAYKIRYNSMGRRRHYQQVDYDDSDYDNGLETFS
jgi:hypothetical protein